MLEKTDEIQIIENIKKQGIRPQCPCCLNLLTDEQVRAIWSDYTRSRKKNFPAGPGRPRIYPAGELCECGQPMSTVRYRPNHRNPKDGLPCRGIGFI